MNMISGALAGETLEPLGAPTRDNLRYPPVTLAGVFEGRPEVLVHVTSRRYTVEGHWQEVEGPYTETGHLAALTRLAAGTALLEAEPWVAPLPEGETRASREQSLRRCAKEYEERYIDAWSRWLADLTVSPPATVAEAIVLYGALARPEWPHLRILRTVEDHTQWQRSAVMLQKSGNTRGATSPTWIDAALDAAASGEGGSAAGLDLHQISGRPSRVPQAFEQVLAFGLPGKGASTGGTPLAKYLSILDALRDKLQRLEDERPGQSLSAVAADLAEAEKQTEALLRPYGKTAQKLLGPLLLPALRIRLPVKKPARLVDPTGRPR